MNKFISSLLLTFSLSLVSLYAETNPLTDFPSRVQKFTLKNGMRLIVVERPGKPVFSVATFIRTGGMDDTFGMSGIAHMFEHMLFKGTKTIGTKNYAQEAPLLKKIDKAALDLQAEMDKGLGADLEKLKKLKTRLEVLQKEHETFLVEEEFWQIYERAGGEGINASTGYDYTNYVISLPINRLKLWMLMESDRIKNPVLREFYKERNVVREERRQRIDNSPQGKLWEAFLGSAFVAHPYGRPIVGWEHDLSRITRKNADDFFKVHYDVSRLVVTFVGGVQAEEVHQQMKKYFESIPSQGPYNPPPIPVEPVQNGERRVEVLYDAEPSLLVGFHRPNLSHPDSPALDVVAEILDSGRTSRFYKALIEKKQIAISAWAGSTAPGERDPNLFVVGGSPRAPNTLQDLEMALYKEMERLEREGPTDDELKKVKNKLDAHVLRSLASNGGLAHQLGYYESVAGDWKILFDLLDQIKNITAIDVQNVMKKYLRKENRTVAVLHREEKN